MPHISPNTLRRVALSNPEARRWIAHYTTGAVLPSPSSLYTSTAELKSVDARADAKIRAVDVAVHACAKLSDADRADWDSFKLKWQDIHQRNQDIIGSTFGLGAGDALAETNSTFDTVTAMQDRVNGVCPKIIGPSGFASGMSMTSIVVMGLVLAAVLTGFWIASPLILAAMRPRALSQGSSS